MKAADHLARQAPGPGEFAILNTQQQYPYFQQKKQSQVAVAAILKLIGNGYSSRNRQFQQEFPNLE